MGLTTSFTLFLQGRGGKSRKAVRRGIRKYFIRVTLVSDIVLTKNREDFKKGVLEWFFFSMMKQFLFLLLIRQIDFS